MMRSGLCFNGVMYKNYVYFLRKNLYQSRSPCSPLTTLLRKDGFDWTDSATAALSNLKDALSSAPVLALPNFKKEFIMETDASSTGIGAVLMQDHHPISYISRALGPRHQSLSVYEKELLAVIHAVQTWNSYPLTER